MNRTTILLLALLLSFLGAQARSHERVVNARQLVCKICGCINPDLPKDDVAQAVRDSLQVEPSFEPEGMWIDSVDGFSLVYENMDPNLSVLVSFDKDGNVRDYTYFFTFPYEPSSRSEANLNQSFFVGNMLQELYDAQALTGANQTTGAVAFDVDGFYQSHPLNIKLMDDSYTVNPPLTGQYILLMEVGNAQPPMADL